MPQEQVYKGDTQATRLIDVPCRNLVITFFSNHFFTNR
jgi:hypothetical protein